MGNGLLKVKKVFGHRKNPHMESDIQILIKKPHGMT